MSYTKEDVARWQRDRKKVREAEDKKRQEEINRYLPKPKKNKKR